MAASLAALWKSRKLSALLTLFGRFCRDEARSACCMSRMLIYISNARSINASNLDHLAVAGGLCFGAAGFGKRP